MHIAKGQLLIRHLHQHQQQNFMQSSHFSGCPLSCGGCRRTVFFSASTFYLDDKRRGGCLRAVFVAVFAGMRSRRHRRRFARIHQRLYGETIARTATTFHVGESPSALAITRRVIEEIVPFSIDRCFSFFCRPLKVIIIIFFVCVRASFPCFHFAPWTRRSYWKAPAFIFKKYFFFSEAHNAGLCLPFFLSFPVC